MISTASPRRISGLSEIALPFRAILSDVWGVVHNGLGPFHDAVEALTNYRQSGGIVLLISNAPRPDWSVEEQLDAIGVDRACYDGLITSGDVARAKLSERPGTRLYHLGPDRDLLIYQGLNVELCDLDSAEIVSCIGLVDDESETAGDYDPLLAEMARRHLGMICANPDLVVERGDRLLPCAGALAARYQTLGGEVTIIGKPHPPIYEQALAAIGELAGEQISADQVLAVGDGAGTDITGANRAGITALFIASGIHAGEYEVGVAGEFDAVARLLRSHAAEASSFMSRLSW